jgi:peptidoglycan/xylan/chitin deacetylase (PgdA/CDA1 family)
MLAKSNRFDSSDIIFVKRILQSELHLDLRKIIIDKLYSKFVNVNENVFSRELYLNVNQLKLMVNLGMHIGAHGYNHFWFEKLDKSQQEIEIKKSIHFLKEIGTNINYMTLCYPYGSYNNITIELLKNYNFQCAFTTVPVVANLKTIKKFEIPRLDTNDLPIN